MSSKPTLYSAWFCPFAQRAWMALEQKGVSYEYTEVDPYKKTPEFLAVCPRGMVPSIIDNGKVVIESGTKLCSCFNSLNTRYDCRILLFVLGYVMLLRRHNSCFWFATWSRNTSGRPLGVNRIRQNEQPYTAVVGCKMPKWALKHTITHLGVCNVFQTFICHNCYLAALLFYSES